MAKFIFGQRVRMSKAGRRFFCEGARKYRLWNEWNTDHLEKFGSGILGTIEVAGKDVLVKWDNGDDYYYDESILELVE